MDSCDYLIWTLSSDCLNQIITESSESIWHITVKEELVELGEDEIQAVMEGDWKKEAEEEEDDAVAS